MTDTTIEVSLTFPGAVSRKTDGGAWFASNLSEQALEDLATASDPLAAGDRIVHHERDASVVFVGHASPAGRQIIGWKGLTSIQEVFYARLPDGGWIITDHFRNAVAALPLPMRTISDGALLQHYVGAAVYGRETYSRGVDRLFNGDRVIIDGDDAEIACFSRHTSIATDEPMSVHLDRIDAALEDLIAPLRGRDGLAIGFSGGVDSTLLLSYLGADATALTVIPGSPEFDAETDYAREAAELLGSDFSEIRLDESDYLTLLESFVETTAWPLESYVAPVVSVIYEHASTEFLVGEAADSIFGSGRGIRRVASALSGPIGRTALRLAGVAPGALGRRARQINGYAELFAEPPDSPRGYAGQVLVYYGDLSPTLAMFGEDAVLALSRRMLDEVAERVELENDIGARFHRHIETAQWRSMFSDLAMAGNHSVQALGKRQYQPFSSWRVISELLKIPASARYYRGLTGKWVLKELLDRRVPAYETNKRKLATALPFERYFDNGPLTGFWDKYDVPAAIPSSLHANVTARATPMTWKAMTHAIWEKRVASNAGLQPIPAIVGGKWPSVT